MAHGHACEITPILFDNSVVSEYFWSEPCLNRRVYLNILDVDKLYCLLSVLFRYIDNDLVIRSDFIIGL